MIFFQKHSNTQNTSFFTDSFWSLPNILVKFLLSTILLSTLVFPFAPVSLISLIAFEEAQAQTTGINGFGEIEQQASQIDVTRQSEIELRETITRLKQENSDLENQIFRLRKEKSDLEIQRDYSQNLITNLEKNDLKNSQKSDSNSINNSNQSDSNSLDNTDDSSQSNPTTSSTDQTSEQNLNSGSEQPSNDQSTISQARVSQNTQKIILEEQAKVDQAIQEILKIETEIQKAEAIIQTNKQKITEAEKLLVQKTQERENQELQLGNQLLDQVYYYSRYVVLIAFFFLLHWLINKLSKRFILNTVTLVFIKWVSTSFLVIATFVTVVVIFAGNLSLIFSSFGILSAGLAIALQDFISSFFAWILIVTKRYYSIKDVLTVNTNHGPVTGSVKDIGLFRTNMDERIGGQNLDQEMNTGKIISFPNNLVLKDSIVNATRNHPILWHKIDITITFETNETTAEQVIRKCIHTEFTSEKYPFIKNYPPRILLNIADSGPCFTIWFASKAGTYRETLTILSKNILSSFRANHVELAYPTIRTYGVGGLGVEQ